MEYKTSSIDSSCIYRAANISFSPIWPSVFNLWNADHKPSSWAIVRRKASAISLVDKKSLQNGKSNSVSNYF